MGFLQLYVKEPVTYLYIPSICFLKLRKQILIRVTKPNSLQKLKSEIRVRNLNSSTTHHKSFIFLYGLFLIELVRQRQTTRHCTASKSVHKDVHIYVHIATILQSIHASPAENVKWGGGKKRYQQPQSTQSSLLLEKPGQLVGL